MRKLGLLPTTDSARNGFLAEELNSYFSSISVSLHENPTESYNTISTASTDGFSFHTMPFNDVILAVAHFKSQARGERGILH